MLSRISIALLTLCSLAHSEVLSGGMSKEDVQVERGRPESTMELGSKEVFIYEDGTRLEFMDGKLVKENDQLLTIRADSSKRRSMAEKPLLSAEEIVPKREEITIGGTVQKASENPSDSVDNFANNQKIRELSIEAEDAGARFFEKERTAGSNRIMEIAISFAIEVAVTLLVLSIAFQISGFPNIFRQLLLLSLAVALVGAVLETILGVGPLSLIRSAVSFLILSGLIRQLTDVREWSTAIKIAIIARLVSLGIFWVLLFAGTLFFSL